MSDRLYLDHAATAPMTDAAQVAVAEAMMRWANPSSPHAEGRAARAALEDARARIAAAYGWNGEVLLTSGASESLRIAFERATVAERTISAVEHDAVMRLAGPETRVIGVDGAGLLRLPSVPRKDRTKLLHPFVPSEVEASLGSNGGGPSASLGVNGGRQVALDERGAGLSGLTVVQWCNSETGVRQPVASIADAVHAAGGLLLLDAAQLPAGTDPAAVAAADFVALSAHKRGGPAGVGALLVRDLATLAPTGGQERGYRPGTENVPGALGYAAALAEAEPDHAELRARLDDAIRRSGGIVVADDAPRHSAIGAYRMPGVAALAQLIRFDMGGIAVSAGSACASGSEKPSHVLAAMGWDMAAGREVVRVSFGRRTGVAEVDRFVSAWRDIARSARARAA